MRMIVEAFKDTLELGLSKNGQVVVSLCSAFYAVNGFRYLR